MKIIKGRLTIRLVIHISHTDMDTNGVRNGHAMDIDTATDIDTDTHIDTVTGTDTSTARPEHADTNTDKNTAELSTGHFSWTRPDPTRRNVDPTRPDPR